MSADDFLHIMGWGDFSSAAGVTVNVDNALGVPVVAGCAGVNNGAILASTGVKLSRDQKPKL